MVNFNLSFENMPEVVKKITNITDKFSFDSGTVTVMKRYLNPVYKDLVLARFNQHPQWKSSREIGWMIDRALNDYPALWICDVNIDSQESLTVTFGFNINATNPTALFPRPSKKIRSGRKKGQFREFGERGGVAKIAQDLNLYAFNSPWESYHMKTENVLHFLEFGSREFSKDRMDNINGRGSYITGFGGISSNSKVFRFTASQVAERLGLGKKVQSGDIADTLIDQYDESRDGELGRSQVSASSFNYTKKIRVGAQQRLVKKGKTSPTQKSHLEKVSTKVLEERAGQALPSGMFVLTHQGNEGIHIFLDPIANFYKSDLEVFQEAVIDTFVGRFSQSLIGMVESGHSLKERFGRSM